jgi:hypothetical protein
MGDPRRVAQHERQALRRRQRVQDDPEREPDGVGQERLMLGTARLVEPDPAARR